MPYTAASRSATAGPRPQTRRWHPLIRPSTSGIPSPSKSATSRLPMGSPSSLSRRTSRRLCMASSYSSTTSAPGETPGTSFFRPPCPKSPRRCWWRCWSPARRTTSSRREGSPSGMAWTAPLTVPARISGTPSPRDIRRCSGRVMRPSVMRRREVLPSERLLHLTVGVLRPHLLGRPALVEGDNPHRARIIHHSQSVGAPSPGTDRRRHADRHRSGTDAARKPSAGSRKYTVPFVDPDRNEHAARAKKSPATAGVRALSATRLCHASEGPLHGTRRCRRPRPTRQPRTHHRHPGRRRPDRPARPRATSRWTRRNPPQPQSRSRSTGTQSPETGANSPPLV